MAKKVLNAISTAVTVLIVIIVLLLVGGKLFGVETYWVSSGSMEPKYPVGSLVYVEHKEPEEIKINDVISFHIDNGGIATHRVKHIDSEKRKFTTKGDNNNSEDAPIEFESLIGKVIFSVPLLGYVASFVSKSYGKWTLVAIIALLLLSSFLPELFSKKKKDTNQE